MGLSHSTYYDVPSLPTDDAALVATDFRDLRLRKPHVLRGRAVRALDRAEAGLVG